MMHLYTGHPAALKEAFLDFIKEHKKNPFDKALVVLPSRRLEAALKQGAAAHTGCVSAVYFMDFLQLASSINAGGRPLLPSTYKQDFAIKDILQKYGISAGRGHVSALKNTFRDLAAAAVGPGELVNLKNDDALLTPQQKEHLGMLTVLYNEYLESLKTPDYNTYYELFQSAAANAANAPFLGGFKRIIFYGFYDFTAIQFELFKNISESFDISVFFPYENNPAYKFAKNFYEVNLLPRAKKIISLPAPQTPLYNLAARLFETVPAAAPQDAPVKITSVSGPAAEIEAAAKEILFYKENLGIDFKDIALTARSMEVYKNDILNILNQNQIPCNISFDTPLLQSPLATFIYNLLRIAKNNFYKDDVLAVLTSPYFKNRRSDWAGIIKNIGVTAGYAQWLDLLPLSAGKESAREIAKFLEEAKNLLARLEEADSFENLSALAAEVIERYTDTSALTKPEQNIFAAVQDILAQIKTFTQVRPKAQRGEFLEEFSNMLKEQTFTTAQNARGAVAAADIMALRGQDFKAVVVMGLNEGLLPAPAQEDPVLKDIYRKTLAALGFLIRARQDRYDEEKLLFYFALSSAAQNISLIYQRSGDDGKPKIPSLYLNRVLALLGQDMENNKNFVLSRRPGEKYKQWPAALLNRREAALYAALESPKKAAALAQIFDADEGETKLFEAANALNAAHTLTPYDGITAPIKQRAISPSDLQILFKCPARYLFEKITQKDEERPFERAALAPLAKGTLYHEILEHFYKHLKQNKLFDKIFAGGAKEVLKDFLKDFLPAKDYKKYGLYPLMWDVLRADMSAFLEHFIEEDLKLMQAAACEPAMFEEKIETEVPLKTTTVNLRGKIDRVDISSDGKTYRIIDYKTKRESAEIKKAIFEKAVLQPPLYFEMAQKHPALQGKTPAAAALLGIEAQGKINKDLSYEEYKAMRPKFIEMIEYILGLAADGSFIITPSENSCNNCRFDTLCRKAHQGTLRRAKASAAAKKLSDFHAS